MQLIVPSWVCLFFQTLISEIIDVREKTQGVSNFPNQQSLPVQNYGPSLLCFEPEGGVPKKMDEAIDLADQPSYLHSHNSTLVVTGKGFVFRYICFLSEIKRKCFSYQTYKFKISNNDKSSEQFDILLHPDCKALKSIWNGDEGEAEEKSKTASELSQQGGERIEENLVRNTIVMFSWIIVVPPPQTGCSVTQPRCQ